MFAKSLTASASVDLIKRVSTYKIYFEMNDLSKALDSYKKADDLFVVSEKSESLNRDSQFQGWVSNNKIALHHTENLLKK